MNEVGRRVWIGPLVPTCLEYDMKVQRAKPVPPPVRQTAQLLVPVRSDGRPNVPWLLTGQRCFGGRAGGTFVSASVHST